MIKKRIKAYLNLLAPPIFNLKNLREIYNRKFKKDRIVHHFEHEKIRRAQLNLHNLRNLDQKGRIVIHLARAVNRQRCLPRGMTRRAFPTPCASESWRCPLNILFDPCAHSIFIKTFPSGAKFLCIFHRFRETRSFVFQKCFFHARHSHR